MNGLVRFCCCVLVFLLLGNTDMHAQTKSYTIKNGTMYISISKQLSESSLDSFISQFALQDLALKEFINKGFEDSLRKLGWAIASNTPLGFMLSKPLQGISSINNPADRISFTEKHPTIAEMFPAVHNSIVFGYNRFRNKSPFTIKDSAVTFYLRNNNNAKRVMLAGSFNDWKPDALSMTKVDSGWIAVVKLAPGKYWYKFIVDGNWIVDNDNRIGENDGLGNVNSVFYKTNIVFRLNSYTNAKRVYLSGSFNNWDPNGLLMNKTETGWEIPLYLADGTHTYRFVADGHWFEDPSNPNRLPNEFGEFNSALRLGRSYLFKLDGYQDAKKVTLTGSFNGWRNNELFMIKSGTSWQLNYTLGPGNYEYRIFVDNKPVSGNQPLVIQPNYTFRLKAYPNAKRIFLSGEFNNWSETAYLMKKEGDEWVFSVHLSPGKHLYKFIVDGNWVIDPGNKLWEQNEQNTGNSVLWIGK
jgi:hypothetical protein